MLALVRCTGTWAHMLWLQCTSVTRSICIIRCSSDRWAGLRSIACPGSASFAPITLHSISGHSCCSRKANWQIFYCTKLMWLLQAMTRQEQHVTLSITKGTSWEPVCPKQLQQLQLNAVSVKGSKPDANADVAEMRWPEDTNNTAASAQLWQRWVTWPPSFGAQLQLIILQAFFKQDHILQNSSTSLLTCNIYMTHQARDEGQMRSAKQSLLGTAGLNIAANAVSNTQT